MKLVSLPYEQKEYLVRYATVYIVDYRTLFTWASSGPLSVWCNLNNRA